MRRKAVRRVRPQEDAGRLPGGLRHLPLEHEHVVPFEMSLGLAHPDYVPILERVYGTLAHRYPWAPLKEVRIYQGRGHDRSMGSTSGDGVISFNSYWFSQPLAFLHEAGEGHHTVPVGNSMIAWHGPMTEEPAHVLTHEFGHVIALADPRFLKWSRKRWRSATANVFADIQPSGYALEDADEYWAEVFALNELGYTYDEDVARMLW